MANEAVMINSIGTPVHMMCAEGTTIAKGTLLKPSGARGVAASTTAAKGELFAGIAAAEKEGGDGANTIAVHKNGIFDLSNSGRAITTGVMVALSGANLITAAADADFEAGTVIGKALETRADEVVGAKCEVMLIGV